jgi:small subunit ribosomal protein S3
MGQKTHPIGFRLGIVKDWDSKWFAKRNYAELLKEDLLIKRYLKKRLFQAGISKITIERKGDKITIGIRTARPGLVIGRKGEHVDKLSEEMKQLTKKIVQINIEEVKRADLDAQLVAEPIAAARAARFVPACDEEKAIASMRAGAKGIRIACSAASAAPRRRGSRDLSRRTVPLHVARRHRFCPAIAHTAYGTCGVKVWMFHGEVLDKVQGGPARREQVRSCSHVDAEASQIPQTAARPHERQGLPRRLRDVRRVRAAVARAVYRRAARSRRRASRSRSIKRGGKMWIRIFRTSRTPRSRPRREWEPARVRPRLGGGDQAGSRDVRARRNLSAAARKP